MEVYLDNSATTKPYKEVADTIYDTLLNCYGNPSSLHRMGKNAEDFMEECRKTLSSTVYCTPDELYFTSGGTESDNTAILGYADANKRSGKRIITQVTEHSAILEPCRKLQEEGFDVVFVGVDSRGFPDMEELRASINEDTILMSFMYVNNENGAIFPIDKIAEMKPKGCALHVDAVQAYGKVPINLSKLDVDMMSFSSHKIHGPNGMGALYVKRGTRINPLALGGKQEKGLRSGTSNLAGIAGFAKAGEIKCKNLAEDAEKMNELRCYLKDRLTKNLPDVVVNTPENSVCAVLNLSFKGVKSEVLLHVLESKGIYVSTGSACNSKKKKFSHVLKAMGLKEDVIDSAVRFSFCGKNTMEEMEYVCDVLEQEIPTLRKIMK